MSTTNQHNTNTLQEYIQKNSNDILDVWSFIGFIGEITFVQQTGGVIVATKLLRKLITGLQEEVPEGTTVTVNETHTWKTYEDELLQHNPNKQAILTQLGNLKYTNNPN